MDILTDDEQKLKKALFDEELDILAFNRRSEGEYIVTTNLANYASVQKMLQAWQENGVIRAYTANTAIVKIALIGYRLKTHERLFKTLATVGEFSKVYQLELSERQVILIVPEEDSNKVMNYLHKELIEKQN